MCVWFFSFLQRFTWEMTKIYGSFFPWAICNLTKTTISMRFPLKLRNSRSRWGIRHIHGPFPGEINLGSVGVLAAAAGNELWPSPLAEKDPPKPGFGRTACGTVGVRPGTLPRCFRRWEKKKAGACRRRQRWGT